MMAGFVYLCVGPTSFFINFMISEIIAWLSSKQKGGLLMIKKAFTKIKKVLAHFTIMSIKKSWEAYSPYRVTLLTSL